jgi:type I restriction enzyme S subunit
MPETAIKPIHIPLEAKGWQVDDGWRRLEDLCDGVFDCPHTTPIVTESGPYVVRSQDIRTGIFRLSEAGHVSEETYTQRISRAEPRYGDLLYSREGTYFGIAAEMPEGTKVCLGQRMVLIRPKAASLNSRFLRYWLNSPTMARHIEGFRDGTVAERLNMPVIRSLPVPVFRLKTQRAIASILGAIDDKIELNGRMNDTLEATALATFKDWFVNFGPTRAKMEGRAAYLAPEIWREFPCRLDNEEKPVGWERRPVSDFAEIRGGKQLARELLALSGPVPVFGGAGVMGFTTTHNADGFVISVGRVGAYCGQFFSFRGKAWINNNASLVQPKDNVSGEWLFLALRHADIDVIKKGAAQPFISNGDVAVMDLIWPKQTVITIFTELIVPLLLKSTQNDTEVHTLAALRDGLLPKLMSGEIHVSEAEKLVAEVA